MTRWIVLTSLLALSGCPDAEPPAASTPPPAPEPEPTSQPASQPTMQQLDGQDYESSIPSVLEDGSEQYGQALGTDSQEISLAQLLESPDSYAGKTVRTAGVIDRVCKAMGCWIEVKDEAGHSVRAPMAGHSYFLPQKVMGKQARLEGTVSVDDDVSIEASGVVVSMQ